MVVTKPKRPNMRRSRTVVPRRKFDEQKRSAPVDEKPTILRHSASVDELYPIYPRRQKRQRGFEFERLKCLRDHQLFEDPEFPPEVAIEHHPKTEWRRPFAIVSNPRFFTANVSRHDVQQMGLGDCFFLAPLSLIADRTELIRRVVPAGQSFNKDFYAGIFHFCLWKYGEWLDIVIDDRLPVNVRTGQLRFTRARSYNVFWVSLLEKAFAKLYGSYTNIQGGHAAFAMQNLTGGISVFNLWSNHSRGHLEKVWKKLVMEFRLGVLFCPKSASTKWWLSNETSKVSPEDLGIQPGHAYALTGLKEVRTVNGTVRLLRVRNPWGRLEWHGDWSRTSKLWQTVVDPLERREMVDLRINGEFWISFEDFTRYFKNVDRCYLGPEVIAKSNEMGGKITACHFDYVYAHGEWSTYKNTNGGGFPKAIRRGTFFFNPQYIVTLKPRPDSMPDSKGRVLVIWQIVQKFAREHNLKQLFSSCVVYKLPNELASATKRLPNRFFQRVPPMNNIEYSILTSQRKKYAYGSYLFVPFCHKFSYDGYFLLRIYANAALSIRKLDIFDD
ncbi:unnamed protein product [Bursaphelenchus xylophilus]|uniref:(pine wood nematode) hypothetical protein n=1 Tax=Bursaphelenchus xylophilus TaxID=6326 RepID=A0A1I7RWT1_BURXY|nr:unnamed protein product [Bursaphelenchus xylophilus]CAG9128652.1 unnamed protein product [Bursaphelenchus xylophilus]